MRNLISISLIFLFSILLKAEYSYPKIMRYGCGKINTDQKNNLKINFLDLSYISLVTVKADYERYLFNNNFSVDLELGKTLYSMDEKCKVNGNFIALGLNYYTKIFEDEMYGIKIAPYYNHVKINDYLKQSVTIPNFGTFTEYKKTQYEKIRYGINILGIYKLFMNDNWFSEVNIGLGGAYFKTKVPDFVTQKSFRNGILREQEYSIINLIFSWKFGYCF